ncbi:phospholipase D-like domain-containing protein [Acidovorax radicis]|uniref:phospholipase D-like domain-containing protein n=1 Tax=Acidovorax radicis TaxID=758826 RepID=UPI001CF9754C|nr:phospholipase D-like domain-containing protein [Acidovorax radicis]UCV00101.1 cardiolipin synthase [Acidovorax radicis]
MTWLAVLSGLGHTMLVMAGLLVYVLATRIGHQRRNPSAAVAWVIAMAALPYLTLPLFLLIGTRKFARPLRRTRGVSDLPASLMPATLAVARAGPPPAAEATGPAWATQLLACMELAPAVRNTSIAWHADGAMALQGLMRTIDSATRSLDLCTFVFANDAIGTQVAQALLRAAQRQVVVRVLVDAVGSLHAGASTLRALEDAGVSVRRFMPLFHNPMRGRTNLRNHRKLVVADQHYLWSGGRNLAMEYFLGRPGQSAWIDLSYEVCGPLAMQATTQFDRDWAAASGLPSAAVRSEVDGYVRPGGAQEPTTPQAVVPEPGHGALAQWVPSGPDHADDTVHTLLLAGAYHAQQRIVAVTPYFVPDDALLDAWCLACRRGVQVTLLLPQRSNHRLADWARERALRALAAAGAQIWLAPAMVHAKAILIDDDFALSGSLNLDARSLFLNYEAMTAFYGATDLRWLYRWCDEQMAKASPYQAHQPHWVRDVAEGVVRAVAFQL